MQVWAVWRLTIDSLLRWWEEIERKKKVQLQPKFVLFCSVHFHNSPIKARTATVVHLHMSVCLGLSMWRSFKTAIYLIHCTIGHMRCGRSVNRCENIGLSNREQSFSLVSLSGSQKKMSSALQFHCSAAAEATSADEERPEYHSTVQSTNVAKQQQQKNTDWRIWFQNTDYDNDTGKVQIK